MITLCDFIERQISKHLKLDRIEAKILDEDNKNLYFMWGKIRRRYTKGDTFTLPTGQASKLVHCSKSEIVPIMKKLEPSNVSERVKLAQILIVHVIQIRNLRACSGTHADFPNRFQNPQIPLQSAK